MVESNPVTLDVVPPPPASSARAIVRNTLASVTGALAHLPEWAGVLAWSELDQRVLFRRPPPMASRDAPGAAAARIVGERDVDRIRLWFEDALGVVVSKQTLVDAVRVVAHDHAFHPVRDYLQGLAWDGVPRVGTWLEDFAGVRPASPAHARLVRAIARRWLLSCVARAVSPGCKVDAMLVIEGRQGIGKSTALARLAGPGFFSDAAIDFGSKEACQTLQGAWIFELAELDALLRRETSVVKAFLSRATDRFRAPYGRAPEDVPRSVVFAGTVNHGGYLRDTTGNRRFWVVRAEGPLDTDGLGAARDALWAEAAHLHAAGEAWHLSPDEEALLGDEQEDRLEADPWEDAIGAFLARLEGRDGFTMNDVLESALGLPAHARNPRVTLRASRILERMGFERRRRAALPRTYAYFRARAEGGALS
jgi:putative DNA primase/helicase